jgi:membrane associated rhomboid family serine protease
MLNQFGPVIKNIILLNIVVFIIKYVLLTKGIDIDQWISGYDFYSPFFRPFQIITHLFSHGSLTHLIFNMLALAMFGKMLEKVWGSKRFFIFYFISGIGAYVLTNVVHYYELIQIKKDFFAIGMRDIDFNEVYTYIKNSSQTSFNHIKDINQRNAYEMYSSWLMRNGIGASGAVYGVLAASALLFGNTELRLMWPPITIKVKWLVLLYIGLEFYNVFMGLQTGVGHWAHIGGAITGAIIVFIWKFNKKRFY